MHRHSFRMNHSMHWIRRIDLRDISNEIVKLLRFQLLGFWFNGFFMSYNFNKSSLFISCGVVIVLDGVLRNIFFYLRDVLSYLWILSWNELVETMKHAIWSKFFILNPIDPKILSLCTIQNPFGEKTTLSKKNRKQWHNHPKVLCQDVESSSTCTKYKQFSFSVGFVVLLAFVCRSNRALSSNSTWCFLRTLPLWLC